MRSHATGLRVSGASVLVNVFLAVTKITVGIVGNAYALVADGIESTVDILSSLIVWSGLRIAVRPPDDTHPYGHGKAESLAAVAAALLLLAAAALIAVQSIREIRTPHHAPEWYTLAVLVGIVILKESMFRVVHRAGEELNSQALRGDAWHHRSDALTSVAAFVGISIALIGGEGYEIADDLAALAACVVIVVNAGRLLRPAMDEVMDAAVPTSTETQLRALAAAVDGVHAVEKTRVRKSGMGLLMDIHIEVDGELSVRVGHGIAHDVKDRILGAGFGVVDVVVHVEP
ncbi:cation diffusion facilitator family transporter, partial [bacterium]|nr:cation diffusion facilitator family transporter [bacterium]